MKKFLIGLAKLGIEALISEFATQVGGAVGERVSKKINPKEEEEDEEDTEDKKKEEEDTSDNK